MLSEERLFEQYHQRGIVQNGELYLRAATAFDFVAQCEENDLAIIGIEGFTVENGEIRPRLDLIGDFSLIETFDWRQYRDACIRFAKRFICGLPTWDGIVLTFVLLSQEEWADDFKEATEITGISPNGQQPSLLIPQTEKLAPAGIGS